MPDHAHLDRAVSIARHSHSGSVAVLMAALAGIAASPAPAQQAAMAAAPVRATPGAPFLPQSIKDVIAIGDIANDTVSAGAGAFRAYLFRAGAGAVQFDAVSKSIDSMLEIYEPGASQPLLTDDDGGGGLNARLILPKGSYKQPLIVVVRDAGGTGGRFELRAARLDDSVASAPARLTIGQSVYTGLLDDKSLRRAGLDFPYAKYVFKAHAGQRVQIDVESGAFDPTIELFYGSRRVGGDEDSGVGKNSRMLRYLTGDGDYTLTVMSLTNQLGAYTVRVTEAAPAKPSPDIQRIDPGQSVDGTFAVESPVLGDRAYALYRFAGSAGQSFKVTLAWAGGAEEGQAPLLYLDLGAVTPAGFANVKSTVSTRDGDAALEIHFEQAGDLMIRAMGEIDWRGPYRLKVDPMEGTTP